MTAHPIDTEALAKRAGHILFTDGPEQPAATARETCVLLDLLAAAEHRATRAEAQSETRRINAEYWKARIKAVRELHVQEPGVGTAYCIDCEQPLPCDTIRALDGTVTPPDA